LIINTEGRYTVERYTFLGYWWWILFREVILC
jgi:hypothetical protein